MICGFDPGKQIYLKMCSGSIKKLCEEDSLYDIADHTEKIREKGEVCLTDRISEKKRQEIEYLTRQLDQKEQELQEKYCDVGKSIMEKIEKENKEIDHMVDEVIQLKRKLVKAKGQIRCPNCHQYNEPGSSYCSSCGKKLERETCPE